MAVDKLTYNHKPLNKFSSGSGWILFSRSSSSVHWLFSVIWLNQLLHVDISHSKPLSSYLLYDIEMVFSCQYCTSSFHHKVHQIRAKWPCRWNVIFRQIYNYLNIFNIETATQTELKKCPRWAEQNFHTRNGFHRPRTIDQILVRFGWISHAITVNVQTFHCLPGQKELNM